MRHSWTRTRTANPLEECSGVRAAFVCRTDDPVRPNSQEVTNDDHY
jgi:hypothetical protein